MAKSKPYRRRKSKRFFARIIKFLAFIAFIVALVFGSTVFFKIETITVDGEVRYTHEEIQTVSEIAIGMNLFEFRAGAVEEKIEQLLPYVKNAKVSRVLPTGILITVEEWEPAFWMPHLDSGFLISESGKILEQSENIGVMSVTGVALFEPKVGFGITVEEVNTVKYNDFLQLYSDFGNENVLDVIDNVDLTGNTKIFFDYDERFDVIFPYDSSYEYYIQGLLEAVSDREESERGTMDLTNDEFTVIYSPEY